MWTKAEDFVQHMAVIENFTGRSYGAKKLPHV